MPRARLAFVSLALLGSFAAAPPALAGRPKAYRIAGAVKDARGKPAPSDSLAYDAAGLHFTIQYLEPPARRAALASVLGRDLDLFPDRTDASRGYLVFALGIENNGEGDLLFEPGQGRLVTDRQDAEFPLDYSRLYETLAIPVREAITIEEIERAVYSRALNVRPKGAVRKLLVFEGPREPKFKKFEVRLGALHTPAGDIDVAFPFRRWVIEEPK